MRRLFFLFFLVLLGIFFTIRQQHTFAPLSVNGELVEGFVQEVHIGYAKSIELKTGNENERLSLIVYVRRGHRLREFVFPIDNLNKGIALGEQIKHKDVRFILKSNGELPEFETTISNRFSMRAAASYFTR